MEGVDFIAEEKTIDPSEKSTDFNFTGLNNQYILKIKNKFFLIKRYVGVVHFVAARYLYDMRQKIDVIYM